MDDVSGTSIVQDLLNKTTLNFIQLIVNHSSNNNTATCAAIARTIKWTIGLDICYLASLRLGFIRVIRE